MADNVLCIGRICKEGREIIINPDYRLQVKDGGSEKNYEVGDKQ